MMLELTVGPRRLGGSTRTRSTSPPGSCNSEDSALELSITETVRREILHLVPNGRKVEISIRRPDVRVVLGDPAQPAA